MSCFYPRKAIKTSMITSKGKSVIKFITDIVYASLVGNSNLLSGLPCGQCTGCRLERSRQWAIRCMNEAQLHDNNCFITLTFDEPSLQARDNPMSLDKSEFQRFMKRMRKEFDYRGLKLRYYMCGEYGDRFKRPHYHAILFGVDFPDKVLEKVDNGNRYYSSQMLRDLWPFGHHMITDVTFDTCAYVARYIMKKALGKDAWKNYFQYLDEDTGELVGHRIPEYTTMSRRSGIGKAWLDKYLQDVYPKDKIFMRGRGYSKPPKYYDTLYEIVDPSDYSRMKQARVDAAVLRADDNSPDRLEVKQAVKLAEISVLKRTLE